MAGDCYLMDHKKLKCALEFSFIGLCKNIFGCSKARITVHGKIVFKSNNEEMCTLNFDDTIANGQSATGIKEILFDDLSSHNNPSNTFLATQGLKSQPKVISTFSETVGAVSSMSLRKNKFCEIRKRDSDYVHCDVTKSNASIWKDNCQDLDNRPIKMSGILSGSHRTSQSLVPRSFKVGCLNSAELVKDIKNYKSSDRIRCCACKHSDTEDGCWDDDKTSVVVDDDGDEITENFESGKLCLESMEDDEIPQGCTLNGKKSMADVDCYASLLSKIKSRTDHLAPAGGTICNVSCNPLSQEYSKESCCHIQNELPNVKMINSPWKKNSRYRHVCLVCGMAFTFRTNLTRHTKKIHGCRPDRLCSNALQKENPI